MENDVITSDVSEWGILNAVINKVNTRVVVSSRDNEHVKFRLRMFDISSSELIWEKKGQWTAPDGHTDPAFDADGRHLGVYFDQCVEVFDVHQKPPKIIQFCSLQDLSSDTFKVQAIAITRNGKGIAVARKDTRIMAPSNGLMADASLFHQMYPSQHSSSGECGVDVIYTTLVSDVQLTYSPDGLRLCLLGFASFRRSGEIGLRYELVVYCWDTRSRRRLNETRLGEYVACCWIHLCQSCISTTVHVLFCLCGHPTLAAYLHSTHLTDQLLGGLVQMGWPFMWLRTLESCF